MARTVRKKDNDKYSRLASSTSDAYIPTTTTAISSSEHGEDYNDGVSTESSSRVEQEEEQPGDDIKNDDDGNDSTLVVDIEEAIDRLGMGIFQYQIVLVCGLCFAADAMEVLLLSFLQLILEAEWGLTEGQSDSIVSVVFMGSMVGTLILSPLGDRWGRRIIFTITASTISLFGVLTAFCTTYAQILMVRFMVGFGVGGLTVPYDALGEFMPCSFRGKKMLLTSFFWTAGSLLVPLFAMLTLGSNSDTNDYGSWRIFLMFCSLPCVVSTVIGVFFFSESPRWLLSRGKHGKALKILRLAAAKNGKDPFVAFPEGVRLIDCNAPDAELCADTELSAVFLDDDNNGNDVSDDGIDKNFNNNSGIIGDDEGQRDHVMNQDVLPTRKLDYIDDSNHCNDFAVASNEVRFLSMCTNPQWRKISILLGGQWYGMAFMYYGAIIAVSIVFSNIQGDSDDDDINGDHIDFDYGAIFITSFSETIGLTLAIMIVDRVGRVSTQTWMYLLGGTCLLVLFFLDSNAVSGTVMEGSDQQKGGVPQRLDLIAFAFFARMFIKAATSVTWLHTTELLPTRFRATGHGFGKLFVVLLNALILSNQRSIWIKNNIFLED